MSQAPLASASRPLATSGGGSSRSLTRKRRVLSADWLLSVLARLGGVSIIAALVTLLAVLILAAVPSVRTFGIAFLYTSDWRPNEIEVPVRDANGKIVIEDGEVKTETLPPVFGALPAMFGTAISSLLALLFAVPLSFGAALYLVRLSSRELAVPVSFLVEFLAAIPSIAYGMWGLFVLAPFLQHTVEPALRTGLGWLPGIDAWLFTDTVQQGDKIVAQAIALTGRDMFCGGLVLAIMIVPIITAISRDVLKSVPRAQIEGTLALGATWWQSSREMLNYSRAGLFGAVMLGLARAAGETMAITMVIGNANRINASLFAPAQTMSSLLANEFAEASGELHRGALTEVALILLVMSLVFNVVARWLVVGKGVRPAAAH